jgi:hypothetical protein
MPGRSESSALLLIVDALRTARELGEQEWVTQKEPLARELYSNLSLYLTGRAVQPPSTPAAAPLTPVSPATPATPATPAKPAATAPAPATPATPATPAKPATPAVRPATPAPAASGDPSMAKVPQKNRIRAKFAQAKAPYDQLKAADPAAAEAIADLLAQSRQAFAYGEFDESERLIDQALQTLGVQPGQ